MSLISGFFEYFEKRVDPFLEKVDYQPPKTLLQFMWFYIRQMKFWFLFAFVVVFFNAAIEAAFFNFVGEIVDTLTSFTPNKERGWQGLIDTAGPQLLLMLFVVVVIKSFVVFLSAILQEQIIVPSFFTLIRWQSHKHTVQQSMSFFQNDMSGKIATKVFQSGHALGEFMMNLIHTGSFVVAYAFSILALLLNLHPTLGAIVLFWFVGFLVFARIFIPRIRETGRLNAEASAVASGRIVDGYSNIATVKLHQFSKVDNASNRTSENDWVYEGLKGQYEALRNFTRNITSVRVLLTIFSNILVGVCAWQSIELWLLDILSTGEVAFVLALVLRMSMLLNRLMGVLNGLFRGVGMIQNTMDMVAQPLGITDKPNAPELEFKKGQIELDEIKFNYGKQGQLFDGLSLKIKPGEKIGIVGMSGAGKSTLVSLMLRFFDVDQGRVLIDGQDVRDVTQNSLRSHFSMVQQETALFSRSVRENIAHGRPNASLEEIISAAKKAKAHEFIESLEDNKGRRGYDAQIGERGVQLSGGQRQRLAIARVILRDAPILILDEATSALDSEIEAVIQENLSKLMVGKTVIVIAHRLSTIAELDRLIVLENGSLIEEGSHKQLIKSKGKYASLWKRQSGGFIGLGHK